jgi:hypothetical protein
LRCAAVFSLVFAAFSSLKVCGQEAHDLVVTEFFGPCDQRPVAAQFVVLDGLCVMKGRQAEREELARLLHDRHPRKLHPRDAKRAGPVRDPSCRSWCGTGLDDARFANGKGEASPP